MFEHISYPHTFSVNLFFFFAVTMNKYANRKVVNLRRKILSLPVSQPRLRSLPRRL